MLEFMEGPGLANDNAAADRNWLLLASALSRRFSDRHTPNQASCQVSCPATRLNARSASARGVGFALGFSFFVNIQLIGGQTKALDQQNMYSDLYSVYS